MASQVDIYNLALSHIGTGTEVASTGERSQHALACNRFYEMTRDAVLRDFPWPFAKRIAALALVEADPNEEWGYSYRYPTDSLKVRRILSGIRNDNRQSRVPYVIASDATGSLIYTDTSEAEIEYTAKITDPETFFPDFVMALSFRLASYIAPRLTGGDPFKLGERAVKFYAAEMAQAQVSAANEEQAEEDPDSELIRARL